MQRDQILMGIAIAAVCLWGLAGSRWLLGNTRKGEWLVRRFGPDRALWVVRGLLALGLLLGILLATGVVNPVRW